MATISQLITDFVAKSIEIGTLDALDRIYTENKLLHIFGLNELQSVEASDPLPASRLTILDQLVQHAVEAEIIADREADRDTFGALLMDTTTPLPSEVNRTFWEKHAESPQVATDYFYQLSQQTNYIKTREIAKNIAFTHASEFGEIEITINLSKPEKTTEEIRLAQQASSDYPVNKLCIENEGYYGHLAHPGRSNHRVIRFGLGEDGSDKWGFQYSPYSYYDEHSIFFSLEHRPMNINGATIRNLMEVLEYLPHYFVGSNAGLPIVGGSILSHDHYQGGNYTFPLDKQAITYEFELKDSPVKAGIVDWPMSVIRLQSADKEAMVEAASYIIEQWRAYSNEALDILAQTEGTPHNAVTPILRRNGDVFILDLVLRNNRTTADYPEGLFHPHPDVQHIKKENIGLIEVLGLAILPPRLKSELQAVQDALLGQAVEVAEIHQPWLERMEEKYTDVTADNVTEIVQSEVGNIFVRVLKDAGVFKLDQAGQAGFRAFVDSL